MVEDQDGLQPVNEEDLQMRPLVTIPMEFPEEDFEEEPEGPDEVSQFDQRHREPFIGLLYLGYLTETVPLLGHTFKLVTPTQREKLEAGILHKRYVNSIAGEIAWATMTVALYLREIDNEPLPEAIGPSVATHVQERFDWIQDNIKQELINMLFEKCLELDAKVAGALDELESHSKS